MDKIGQFVYERFTPLLPKEQNAHHPIIIAGGGPVGLAIALGLARQGVKSLVIEADNSVCEGSRAICLSRRSLQILQRLGVLEPFLQKGLPWTTGRSYYKDVEVLRFDMPYAKTDKLPPMINIAQYHIEQFLLGGVRQYPHLVDIHWASSVTQMQAMADGVKLQVTNALGSYEVGANYLVAADGGQSFVRKSLGLKLEGQAFTGKFVIVDITLNSSFPTQRRAWFDCACNPGSTMLMHKQPEGLWRIDYQIPDDADLEEAILEVNVRPVVERHLTSIGEGHLPWTFVWSSAYRAGTMTLQNYVHERIIFAGNAAHAMPIFGVRGLNSGLEDADNLAWKLAMVVKGEATEKLLQNYSSERIAAYHVNAYHAGKSTDFMAPGTRGLALMREAALSLSIGYPSIASLLNPRQTSAAAYGVPRMLGSYFTDGLQRGYAPVDVPVNAPVVAGQEAPDCSAQGYLLDRIQSRFTLLVLGDNVLTPRTTEQQAKAPHDAYLPLDVLHWSGDANSQPALSKIWGWSRAYLLRPDGYLVGIYSEISINNAQAAIKTIVN